MAIRYGKLFSMQAAKRFNMRRVLLGVLFLVLSCLLLGGCAALQRDADLLEANRLDRQRKRLFQEGRYQEALVMAKEALSLKEKVLGPEHLDVAGSLNKLACLYYSMGEYDDTLPLLKRSLAIHEKFLDPEHPDVAESLKNLALLYT